MGCKSLTQKTTTKKVLRALPEYDLEWYTNDEDQIRADVKSKQTECVVCPLSAYVLMEHGIFVDTESVAEFAKDYLRFSMVDSESLIQGADHSIDEIEDYIHTEPDDAPYKEAKRIRKALEKTLLGA